MKTCICVSACVLFNRWVCASARVCMCVSFRVRACVRVRVCVCRFVPHAQALAYTRARNADTHIHTCTHPECTECAGLRVCCAEVAKRTCVSFRVFLRVSNIDLLCQDTQIQAHAHVAQHNKTPQQQNTHTVNTTNHDAT